MPSGKVDDYNNEREKLNEFVLKFAGKEIKRFFSLDSQVYREGVLPKKTKEMLGLVASLVLRCDDCIKYHLQECFQENVSTEELGEVVSIGLIVGGSITIPHIRKAVSFWEELKKS